MMILAWIAVALPPAALIGFMIACNSVDWQEAAERLLLFLAVVAAVAGMIWGTSYISRHYTQPIQLEAK